MRASLFIGLMSGTSMDAVDCALIDASQNRISLVDFLQIPFPRELKTQILATTNAGAITWTQLGDLDIELARLFASAALSMVQRHQLAAADIVALGSHGQTLWHQPTTTARGNRFTWQLGDPNLLALLTGITTVADFRRFDMAAGGEGAPLVPAFHVAQFASRECVRVVLNLGGIANITVMFPSGECLGYDTGPANMLMDEWTRLHLEKPFDTAGSWAASGSPDEGLLDALLTDPYFGKSPPKSTGRELFNLNWVSSRAAEKLKSLTPEDVQATLLELTATSIAAALAYHAAAGEVLVCGGGAHNSRLLKSLRDKLPGFSLDTTVHLGIPPNAVEAVAFAWFAKQAIEGAQVDFRPFTGATRPVSAGGIYRP
jgi:anhydro-N-acetylmuramic acid kinase